MEITEVTFIFQLLAFPGRGMEGVVSMEESKCYRPKLCIALKVIYTVGKSCCMLSFGTFTTYYFFTIYIILR